jgi:hypothetical protein
MALSVSQAARENLKNLLICFSIGNLCFLRRWYDLEHLKERSMDYYRTAPANPTLLLATVIGALVLTGVFWLGWLWVKHRPTPAKWKLAHCVFLLTLIYPLESVRRYWNTEADHPDPASNTALFVIEAILLVGLVLALLGNTRIVGAARRVTLFLTLLIPSLLIDFGWARLSATPASAFAPKPPLPMLPAQNPRRVIWMLFDEMDERMAFDLRRPAVELPELDRLMAESFVARDARQTAAWTTLAVPCLLSGRVYSRADLIDAGTLRVFPEGSSRGVSWHDEPNVFRRARDLGVNAALVGWHHPYCRVLGDSLVRCVEVPSGTPTPALLRETSVADEGLAQAVLFLFRLQFANLLDMLRASGDSITAISRDAYVQQRQQKQYFRIRDQAYAAASDRNIGLLFAHFPAPHPLGIYDRRKHDFTLNKRLGYADNLALVDRTVGEMRRALEQAGLWETTTLLITSDHGFRPDLWRSHTGWTPEMEELTQGGQSEKVPFIVKIGGQDRGVVFETPFLNVAASDLILAILNNRIATHEEIAAWMDGRSAIAGKSVR